MTPEVKEQKRTKSIAIANLQQEVPALPGHSILNSLLHARQPIHTICGGRARCGCCRIRILEGAKGMSPVGAPERNRLSPEKIGQGWRLACQSHTLRDIVIHLPAAEELADHCCAAKHKKK